MWVWVCAIYLSTFLSISVMLYTHCTHSIPPQQVQLYQAKDQADKFEGSYQTLVAGLGGVQEAQEKQEPIHSEVEAVKQQLEAHKVGYIANCHSIPLTQFMLLWSLFHAIFSPSFVPVQYNVLLLCNTKTDQSTCQKPGLL